MNPYVWSLKTSRDIAVDEELSIKNLGARPSGSKVLRGLVLVAGAVAVVLVTVAVFG